MNRLLSILLTFLLSSVSVEVEAENLAMVAPVALFSGQFLWKERFKSLAQYKKEFDPESLDDSDKKDSRSPSSEAEVHKDTQDPIKVVATVSRIRGGGELGSNPDTLVGRIAGNIGASTTKCWATLVLSILIETSATSLSKHARDTSSLPKFLAACCLYLSSMCGFALCLAKIEVGIAYAVWSALGTAIVTTIGIVLFGESCDSVKLGCLLLIMVGVVGLNLRESH